MDTSTREQIRLLLASLLETASKDLSRQLEKCYALQPIQDRLTTGATLKDALRILEEAGDLYLGEAIEKVAAIEKDMEAFAMLKAWLTRQIKHLRVKFDDIYNLTRSKSRWVTFSQNVLDPQLSFAGIRSSLESQLEIHRFVFTQPASKSASVSLAPTAAAAIATPAPNKGGKPLAKHWDRLWAHIAAQLYNGDLKPESQAEIECAMQDWFAANEIDVGVTTIRGRARVLWAEIQASP